MTTELKHIEEGYINPELKDNVCTTFGLGPLSIKACIDVFAASISVSADLFGNEIGHCTLDSENTSCTFGGSVAGFKAEVTLTVDFDAKKLSYKIELCAPIVGCTDYSGIIVSW